MVAQCWKRQQLTAQVFTAVTVMYRNRLFIYFRMCHTGPEVNAILKCSMEFLHTETKYLELGNRHI